MMIYDEMFQNGLKTPYELLLTCSDIFKDFVKKKSGKCSFTLCIYLDTFVMVT